MKKYISILISTLLLLSLCACRDEAWEDPDIDTPSTPEKPVIYLYPETETEITVQLDYSGELTCTYPTYTDGWKVTAAPDGTLTDEKGQTYNYLYWEEIGRAHV